MGLLEVISILKEVKVLLVLAEFRVINEVVDLLWWLLIVNNLGFICNEWRDCLIFYKIY